MRHPPPSPEIATAKAVRVDQWGFAANLAVSGLPVFPCHPTGKNPLTKNGFKAASTDLDCIDTWCEEFPDALIVVPTGAVTGLLVVDIDPDGAEWYAEHAAALACGRVHKTRRGHHLLYRMPDEDLRISAGRVAPGVDVRANGGFVIWWPAHGLAEVGDLGDITLPPQWLLERIRTKQPATVTQLRTNSEQIPSGARNQALTSLAGKMRHAGATQVELETALTALNARCNPPLEDREVKAIAASVARYAPAAQPQEPAEALDIEPASQWANRAPPPQRDWVCEALSISAGRVASFGGNGGFGKTTIALQLAIATAAHRPLWGLPINGGGVVAFLCEDEQPEIERRTRAICHAENIDLAALTNCHLLSRDGLDNVVCVFERDQIQLTEFYWTIDKTLDKYKPRLCLIDTAADVFAGDFMSTPHVRQFIKVALGGLCKRHGAALLLLAHPSASAMASGDGGGFSTAWNNSVRSRLYLRSPKSADSEAMKDRRVLEVRKSNYGPTGATVPLIYDNGRFVLDPEPLTEGCAVRAPKSDTRLALAVLQYMRGQGQAVVSFGAIFEALQKAGDIERGNYETVRKPLQRTLKSLCSEGLLQACDIPRGYRKAEATQP